MLEIVLPVAVVAAVTGIWFLLHREKEKLPERPETESGSRVLDTVIIALFFLGVILAPVMVRFTLVYRAFRSLRYACYLNVPCIFALLLSLLRLKKWTVTDLLFFDAWMLLLIPLAVSSRDSELSVRILLPFQNLLPVCFIFFRMNHRSREKTVRLFMILFNCFILFLLAFAVEEKITGKYVIKAFRDWLLAGNMYASNFVRFANEQRFFSFWGHPLTNALLFNCFLGLNTAWYRSRGKTVYALLYFPAAMAGVLLSGSKTGIVICFLFLPVICWKHRKWLLLCVPVLAALYFAGAFDYIISRFAKSSLTSGRLEALGDYFGGLHSEYPFRLLTGYGPRVFAAGNPLNTVREGFEFPLLMFAAEYGIVFSVALLAGSYGYITWRCLKKKQWTIWLCYTLVFAEINTYNGYSLSSQDICILCNFAAMIMLNMLPAGKSSVHNS